MSNHLFRYQLSSKAAVFLDKILEAYVKHIHWGLIIERVVAARHNNDIYVYVLFLAKAVVKIDKKKYIKIRGVMPEKIKIKTGGFIDRLIAKEKLIKDEDYMIYENENINNNNGVIQGSNLFTKEDDNEDDDYEQKSHRKKLLFFSASKSAADGTTTEKTISGSFKNKSLLEKEGRGDQEKDACEPTKKPSFASRESSRLLINSDLPAGMDSLQLSIPCLHHHQQQEEEEENNKYIPEFDPPNYDSSSPLPLFFRQQQQSSPPAAVLEDTTSPLLQLRPYPSSYSKKPFRHINNARAGRQGSLYYDFEQKILKLLQVTQKTTKELHDILLLLKKNVPQY
jgi:hypothetical protein